MSKQHDQISDELKDWIARQHVFFVATAPLAAGGLINCSPKGGDTFRVLDEKTVAYLDLTGSGIETIAHLRENGRIVVMFCAFDGAPLIVRLHGRGEIVLPEHPDFPALVQKFPANPGTRSVIRIHVARTSDSCGMAVPEMDYRHNRLDLDEWAESKGPEKIADYRRKKNSFSLDGLKGL